jgi:hypothetical protein
VLKKHPRWDKREKICGFQDWGYSPAVEHLSSVCEAWEFIPSFGSKKKKRKFLFL